MIRVVLPAHLRTLARIDGEVKLDIDGPVTVRSVLDTLEARYPVLRGTIRDQVTQQRRPFVRFFACEQDLSHESPDTPLPQAVARAAEPFLIVGAIAGGKNTPSAVSKTRVWAGAIITSVAVLFLAFSGVVKLTRIAPVLESFAHLGYPESLAITIGILELACTLLYVIPRTAVLGAIVLTGYLGAATATHVRVGDPLFTHALFPVYVAVLAWIGLYLREDRLSALIPRRT